MKEQKNDGETLLLLKRETCSMIKDNNLICHELWDINRSLEKEQNIDLQNKKSELLKKADKYYKKIHENYDLIVRLEKEINNRNINSASPSFLQILYENNSRSQYDKA